MLRPHALQFWTKVSRNPEMGSSYVTEVKKADGLVRLVEETLEIEVEITFEETTMGGAGYSTETESLGNLELAIPLEEVVSVRLIGSWWWPRVRVVTANLQSLQQLPAAKRGTVDLRIRWRDRGAARALATEFDVQRADLDLRRARELEAREYDRLKGG